MKMLRDDLRGTIAPAAGLLGAILIGFSGLAVDTTRAWLVEARMKSALDAAALVAARRFDEPTRDESARQLFWANIEQGGRGRNFLGGRIAPPVIEPVPGQVGQMKVSSTARVPTTLFNVIKAQEIVRADAAVAQRAGTGLELSIVLDLTGSMDGCDGSGRINPATGRCFTKFDAAAAATNDLINTLYAGREWQRNLFVSVVPYDRGVNIGTANSAWIDTSSAPPGWDITMWGGCVLNRDGPLAGDLSDESPLVRRFRPWAAPSTYRQVGSVQSGRCQAVNAYPAVNGIQYCHGDNDWVPAGSPGPTQAELDGNRGYSTFTTNWTARGALADGRISATGPNYMCLTSRTPRADGLARIPPVTPVHAVVDSRAAVTPLTALRTDVAAAVDRLRPEIPATGNGTNIAAGLQAAWYTLSPRWQNVWQDTNAAARDLGLSIPTLPQAYNLPRNRKAVVILTDGDNNWAFPHPTGAACANPPTATRGVCATPVLANRERNYTGYGRVADYNALFPGDQMNPTNPNTADAKLDNRFRATCAAIKAQGIIIFVVGFEVPNAAMRTMLRDCSTDPSRNYFEAANASELLTAFRRAANELTTLRLVE